MVSCRSVLTRLHSAAPRRNYTSPKGFNPVTERTGTKVRFPITDHQSFVFGHIQSSLGQGVRYSRGPPVAHTWYNLLFRQAALRRDKDYVTNLLEMIGVRVHHDNVLEGAKQMARLSCDYISNRRGEDEDGVNLEEVFGPDGVTGLTGLRAHVTEVSPVELDILGHFEWNLLGFTTLDADLPKTIHLQAELSFLVRYIPGEFLFYKLHEEAHRASPSTIWRGDFGVVDGQVRDLLHHAPRDPELAQVYKDVLRPAADVGYAEFFLDAVFRLQVDGKPINPPSLSLLSPRGEGGRRGELRIPNTNCQESVPPEFQVAELTFSINW